MSNHDKKSIFKSPLFFFNWLSSHFERLYDSLKFSLRTKINVHYLLVVIISYIFSLIVLSFITISLIYFSYKIEAHDDISIIASVIEQNEEGNYTNKLKQLMNEKNVIIETRKVAIQTEETGIVDFIPKLLKNNKLLYQDYINIGNKKYLVSIVYDIYSYSSRLMDFILIVTYSYLICLLFVILFGTSKIKKILRPIFDMTKTAKEITTNNLDLRLDVENSEYELKDLSITLNKMLDRLSEEYNKQKKFVSDVSHELRTPISVIHGYSNMLSRWGKKDQDILNESIEAITKEALNMSDLVSKLLFLARADNETLVYEKKDTNISDVLNELIKESRLIDKGEHIIEASIIPNIHIYADEKRLKQLFRIFIDNAFKYTKEGNKISVEMKLREYSVLIVFEDEGIGIEKSEIKEIFKRFYRSDESRTRQTGGHGLGLSIAQMIVESHKGSIRVNSVKDKGSEFIVELMRK